MLKKRTFGEFDPNNLSDDDNKRAKYDHLAPIEEEKETNEFDTEDVWAQAFGPITTIKELEPANTGEVEMREDYKVDLNDDEADWGASDPFLIGLVSEWFK